MTESHDSPEELLARLSEKASRPDIGDYSAPMDELEESLCGLWGDVLAIAGIGREDGILSLGGDSFHMLLICARLSELYGMEISMGDLFEHATVESMARYLRVRMREQGCTGAESKRS